MKGIFFWATVDIFWVMESWVTKKLLGPNGRAKTQFSLYLGQPKEWAVAGDGTAGCSYKELGVRVEKARCAVGEAGYSWLRAYGR